MGQLLAQEYPENRYEIIVADGMSDDGTREIVSALAQHHPQIRLLDNPKRFSSAGRNMGFMSGSGDYFLVVDGHCHIPDNQHFNYVVDCFARSGADCLGRPQPLDPPGLTNFQKSVALARSSRLGHGGNSLIYGEYEGFASPVSNGAAYSRNVLEKVGYVDENFDAAEDVEYNYRVEQAGFACYTSPILMVKYYPRESLTALFRQMVRYGKGRFMLIRKHPDTLTFNQIIPVLFIAGAFLAVGCLPFAFGHGLISLLCKTMIAIYALYFTIVGVESARICLKKGLRHIGYLPTIFPTVHAGLGWGVLKEAIREVFGHHIPSELLDTRCQIKK